MAYTVKKRRLELKLKRKKQVLTIYPKCVAIKLGKRSRKSFLTRLKQSDAQCAMINTQVSRETIGDYGR